MALSRFSWDILGARSRALRDWLIGQRQLRAALVLLAGLGLSALGFAAVGPSLGAFTATVSSQAEIGAGSLDLSLNVPSGQATCSANAASGFSATCSNAYVTAAAVPGQSYGADWLASSSGTITPQNDPGFSFALTPSSCSGSSITICSDTEATVDELSAEPNVATPLLGYSYQSNSSSYNLVGVSCPSTTICVATGSSPQLGVVATSSDGGQTWSPPTYLSGPLSGTTATLLLSVSCATTTSCVAAGVDETSSQVVPLAETGVLVSGSWEWTPTVLSGPAYFLGVSCLFGTTDCVAVGNASAGFVAWSTTDSGGAWSQPVTLNTAQANAILEGNVTCVRPASALTCVALWDPYPVNSNTQAVAYVGMGSSIGSLNWSAATFPTAGDVLAGVACPSATSCVVVGANNGSSPTAGVADMLSISAGSGSWGAPVTPSGTVALQSVACTSSTDCAAVGVGPSNYDATSTTDDGGTSWSAADQFASYNSANVDQDQQGLLFVACPSATQCAAVGYYGSATSTDGGQSWVGYEPLKCVYGSPVSNGTCSFSSNDTLFGLGGAGQISLQPSTVADPGVIIEVSTELASSSTSDEGKTATVPLTFTATA